MRAIVVNAHPEGLARVKVFRNGACAGECHMRSCEGCARPIVITASNTIGAMPGDRVIVKPSKTTVLAFAVYLLPVLAFLAGAFIHILVAFAGLAGAFAVARHISSRLALPEIIEICSDM